MAAIEEAALPLLSDALDDENTARARRAKKRTRIQAVNEARILDAGLEVFSSFGFRGATLDQIAVRSGMSKPNLLYYFRRKQDIYTAVLKRTLDMWLAPLIGMDAEGDPAAEIRGYVMRKLELSRTHPQESRLYAGEMLQGAPMLKELLDGYLREVVEAKAGVIRGWVAAGKLRPVDPYHLIFMLWATTQHYADFDVQVRSIVGDDAEATFGTAEETVAGVILGGILPRG